MRRIHLIGFFLLACFSHTAWASEVMKSELAPVLYLPFDGNAAAAVPKESIALTKDTGVTFVEGKLGQAADFRKGGCLEYSGLPAFNMRSGTLELWVKPIHDRKDLQDHYYLQFLAKDGTCLIEVKFYQVEMAPQVTMKGLGKTYRRYGWSFSKDQWNHIVVTWDDTDPDLAGLVLYLSGVKNGYPCSYSSIPPPTALRVGCKSLPEGLGANALIDEVCVYNRCLSPGQVKLLYECGHLPFDQKLARVRERIAKDEALSRNLADTLFNHRKLAMIHGRNTSLLNWPDEAFKPIRIPVPDKIHETELARTDLNRYHAVIVPGGGGLNLTDPDKEALLRYVREGGGYVGICGGACTAKRYGLINAESYNFGVRGSVWTTLKPHPITEGYDPKHKLLFPHASGPLFVIKEKSEEGIIFFDVGNPPLPSFAHTIVKEYGKGRVVVFSGHPESSNETRALLRNAVLWAARVTSQDDVRPKTPPDATTPSPATKPQ